MESLTLNFIGNEAGFGNNNTSAYFEQNNELFIIDCPIYSFFEDKR